MRMNLKKIDVDLMHMGNWQSMYLVQFNLLGESRGAEGITQEQRGVPDLHFYISHRIFPRPRRHVP